MQGESLPFLTRVANRLLSNTTKKRLKFARARLFEAFGSQRYSRPALYGMDQKLLEYLPQQRGFFVECGANDGFDQSNTYYFGRFRGWTGLLVEPVPALYELCRRFRPEATVYNCALGPADGGTVEIIFADLMSTTVGAHGSRDGDLDHVARARGQVRREGNYVVRAEVRSLSSILRELGVRTVDLFVLDVEGFELSVLEGVDFAATDIRYILVETSQFEDVEAILATHYTLADRFSHHDYLFRRTIPVA